MPCCQKGVELATFSPKAKSIIFCEPLVPLHPTASHGLQQYLVTRNRIKIISAAVFVSKHGTPIRDAVQPLL
jgi:hypothetical protein